MGRVHASVAVSRILWATLIYGLSLTMQGHAGAATEFAPLEVPFTQAGVQTDPAATLGGGEVSAPNAAFSRANHLINGGDFKQAEAELRKHLADNPASAPAQYLLAYTLLRENKPTDSLAVYTLAAKLRAPSAEDLKYVALDYVLLEAYPEADRWISRSLKMDPKNADAWYVSGRIRYERKRYQGAAECFAKALTLAPGNAKTENNLGLAYEGLNRVDDAIAAYRQAIAWQQASGHPSEQPLLNLAIVLDHRGDIDHALPLLVEAASIAPRDPRIHERLGQLYMRQGHADQAQKEFSAAIAVMPNSAALHFLLGQAYRRQGLTEQAKAELARAAELSGTHSTPDH